MSMVLAKNPQGLVTKYHLLWFRCFGAPVSSPLHYGKAVQL